MRCKICSNDAGNVVHSVREMMYGSRDVFEYMECARCKCLQLVTPPSDMGRYYPDAYYSFQKVSDKRCGLKEHLISLRDRSVLFKKHGVGQLLSRLFPNEMFALLGALGVRPASRILDVGCGAGELLYRLRRCGVTHLLGVDPFNKSDLLSDNGLSILKKDVHGVEGKWDIIMFNHSFEHVPDQVATLKKVVDLLSAEGVCVLRVPTVSSFAWSHYGVNWVNLDAPRHFFLHSYESMSVLVRQVGLEIIHCRCDSNAFQFWGSEQYVRDISLMEDRSHLINRNRSSFSRRDVKMFERKARELNQAHLGDQVAFCCKVVRK